MGTIRPLTRDDLDRLAQIHLAVYDEDRQQPDIVRRAYAEFVPALFLDQPSSGHVSPSLVYEDDGVVVGMVLVAGRRFVFDGEPRWLAATTHLTVLPEARSSLASIRLLRAVAEGPQDLVYADSSNEAGRVSLRGAGFETIPEYSIGWRKVLRPVAGISGRIAERLPLDTGKVMSAVDWVLSAAPQSVADRSLADLPEPTAALTTEPLTVAHVLGGAPELLAGLDLHPDFQSTSTIQETWSRITRLRPDTTIVKRAVVDRRGRCIGWYIVDIDAALYADVVQMVSPPSHRRAVLVHLLHDLRDRGVRIADGALPLDMVFDADVLGMQLLTTNHSVSVHARDDQIVEAFRRRRALLTSLEGEYSADPVAAVPRREGVRRASYR